MGFFKNLKNKMTGGAAEVTVEVGIGTRGQAFPITVHALAKGAGRVNSVYLLITASEHCEFTDSNNNTISSSCETYNTKVTIADGMDLQEGQSYDWQGMLELPEDTNPTFEGEMIQHVWQVQAGLDMPGNDPDSGWVTFEVE
jgi:hypothetical protein